MLPATRIGFLLANGCCGRKSIQFRQLAIHEHQIKRSAWRPFWRRAGRD
jgi:hypothetical protein